MNEKLSFPITVNLTKFRLNSMRLIVVIFVLSVFNCELKAQLPDSMYTPQGYLKIADNPDSVQYSKDYFFNEGIYLNYKDFRQCIAVPRGYILTKIEKNQLEFYNKLFDESDTVVYRAGRGIKIIPVDCVFCYVQNNTVYLNVEGTFCRLPVFGSVCHFIGSITVEAFRANGPFYDPYQNNGGSSITGTPLKSKETRQFLFDFYTGKTLLANIENMEEILKRDPQLFKEYSSLKRRHKNKKIYYFLKQYNQRHPAFFPKA